MDYFKLNKSQRTETKRILRQFRVFSVAAVFIFVIKETKSLMKDNNGRTAGYEGLPEVLTDKANRITVV